MLNNGKLKVNNIEDIKDSMPATYDIKKGQEVGSFYDIILNNKDNDPIAFLAIQFTTVNKIDFTQSELQEILKLKFFIEENLEKMVTKN